MIDVTVALAGPMATLMLAGLGATVIKVENPLAPDSARTNPPYLGRDGVTLARRNDDDMSISSLNRGRGKLAVTLNLEHPEARAVFADLVRGADILVENNSPWVMDRLGVGYAWASEINPRIIFTSLSAFGADEPGGGWDALVQAQSGIMWTSGKPEDPPIRVGVPLGDTVTPVYAVAGTLAALEQRHRTGRGQHVDVSMLGVLTSLVVTEPYDVQERVGIPMRTGNTMPRLAPFGVFRAKDGHVGLAAPTDKAASGLYEAIGRPDLEQDPRFRLRDDRVKHAAELDQIIEAWTSQHTVKEAVAIFERHLVLAAEVRTPAVAVRDPRVVRRGETSRLAHPDYGPTDDVYGTGLPIRFSGSRTGFDQPAARLGQHNAAVYGGRLGYSTERIAKLHADGVI